MEFFVFAVLSLLLRPPFASGAAFTTSGSYCRSLVCCHGQRSCSYRPLFLNAAAASDDDDSSKDDPKTSSTRRDELGFQRDDVNSDTFWSVSIGNEDGTDELKTLAFDRCRRFLTSTMNATVEPIANSNGMSVVRNVFDLEGDETRDIILRNITIPFWQECINTVNIPRIRVAAVGTPGIGKTTSTPWLIRMLLEQGQTVVYLIRTLEKRKWYYEFVPVQRSVTVNIYPERLDEERIRSLRLPSTYYIVDPGESENNCNPPTDFAAKVILVPSPDSRHWGGSGFVKSRGRVVGEFRYFPTWLCEELLIARPILRPEMTEEELRDRFRQFGGVPRHIFRLKIDDFLLAQDMAVSTASSMQAREIALGRMNAFDRFGEQTKSALLAFRLSAEDTGTFEKGESYIVSNLVFEKFNTKFQRDLWNVMLDLGPNGGGGIIFETICRYMMTMRTPPMEFECRRCVGKDDKGDYKNYFMRALGTGTKDIRQVMDPTMAAATSADVVFHPIIPNHRLFDFVYKDLNGHFYFFQTTIGKTHSANVTNIKKLENEVGGASNMTFYFLVPSKVFPTFVTDPVKPLVSCNIYHVSIPSPRDQQLQEDK